MSYFLYLFNNYVIGNIVWILISIALGVLSFFIVRKKVSGQLKIIIPLLVCYSFFVLACMVFTRRITGHYEFDFIPFASYKWMLVSKRVVARALLHLFIFIPIGYLLPHVTKSYRWALLISLIFAVIIEVLQLVTTTGLCEFDDVFHAMIGASIGCYICNKVRIKLAKKHYLKQKNNTATK